VKPKPPSATRVHPRKQVRIEVKIPTATMLKVLWTANISKGGMAIETPNELPIGSPITVALMLPTQQIELQGTVKHATPRKPGSGYFVGVQFAALSDAQRRVVEDIIGSIREFKKKGAAETDAFADSDIEID
jgi:c-di-GMP-binding flagellar brake protein YcgR